MHAVSYATTTVPTSLGLSPAIWPADALIQDSSSSANSASRAAAAAATAADTAMQIYPDPVCGKCWCVRVNMAASQCMLSVGKSTTEPESLLYHCETRAGGEGRVHWQENDRR